MNPDIKNRCVLAIDLGSGGPKAAIIDEKGVVLASHNERIETIFLPNGGAEQNPDEWWQKTKLVAKKAVSSSKISPDQVIAVCCDSQWSVTVPVDKEGTPLMNAIHWMDSRGGSYNRKIVAGFPRVQGYGLFKLIKWLRITGGVPTLTGVDSLAHMLYIKNEHPDVYQKTYKFLEPMDFITMKLTGEFSASQESMYPAILVQISQWGKNNYNNDLLKIVQLDRKKLANLVTNGSILGKIKPTIAKELGISKDASVLTGINDTNASVIGSGITENYQGLVYIGTSLVLTCYTRYRKTDVKHFIASMPSPLQDQYLLMAEQGIGGKSLEFFLRNIVYDQDAFHTGEMPEDAFARVNNIALSAPAGSGNLIFLPWLNGTLTPNECNYARGGFYNMSINTRRSHLTRSVLEGLAFNSRWTMKPAQKYIQKKFETIRFAGGGAQSDLWAQIHADVLGVPVHRVADPTSVTLKGSAFLAFLKLGILKNTEIQNIANVDRIFEPDNGRKKVYDKLFKQYKEIFKRNKPIFKSLNAN